jgi:hypothetical protein
MRKPSINLQAGDFMYLGEERRQYERYSTGSMTASVSFQDNTSGEIFVESVKPVDFNSNGIAIQTNLDFEIGDEISLNISLGRNRVSNIIGTVRNMLKQENNTRYGLKFDFAANEHMRSEEVEEILANIERDLKKKQNSPSRKKYRLNKAIERGRRIKIIGR